MREVWFRKWYESIRDHASVILVSLRVVVRESAKAEGSSIENAHSSECLCNNASYNALEEEGVPIVKDVEACREEEVKV